MLESTGRVYKFGWRWMNRLRRLVGKPTQIKKCCRDHSNLGPRENLDPEGNVQFKRCQVCGCRHFWAVADEGRVELSLKG